MDILSYLTTLIKTHKEVGIPGLGTIYKKKSPGRYDIDTHSFLPPSYSLAFTSDLNEHTLLTDLISKKKNISADAAIYFVERFSQNILDELSSHQESDFGDLGTFSTASGGLTFVPKQETDFGFDFYGLPALKDELNKSEEVHPTEEQLELENNNADLSDGTEDVTDVSKETPADEVLLSHLDSTEPPAAAVEGEQDEQPVYEEIAEVTSVPETQNIRAEPIIETPENQSEIAVPPNVMDQQEPASTGHFTLDYTEEKTGMPGYIKVIIGLAVLILLAGIMFMAKPELFDGILKRPSGNLAEQPDVQAIKENDQLKIDSITRTDSIRKSNEKAIMAADSAKDSAITAKPAEKITPTTVSYEIIAASLLNQKEANNFLADMKRKGIPAKVADMPGRRVKISIGSFTDEEAAKKQLEILKKTTKIPGIYIYPLRHTNNPK